MTFYLLAVSSAPFASELPAVVDQCGAVDMVKPMMARAQITHPNDVLTVTEALFSSDAAMPKIPPELARAAALWNVVADRTYPKLPKIRAINNYVGPYRRWTHKNAARNYFLEDVVAAAERATWAHEWLKFSWLLGSKDGMLNCDKMLHGNSAPKSRRQIDSGNEFDSEGR